jgi:UDP-glucuronate 4-epimerase
MKVFVTGSAGFVGFYTSQAFLERGDEVVGIDNFNDYYSPQLKKDRNTMLEKYKDYKFYNGSICDKELLEKIFNKEKLDKICHLAAQAGVRYSIDHPFAYQQSNLEGFLNIIEFSKQFKVKNFVFASSSSVYGGTKSIPFSEEEKLDKPLSLYGATKISNEAIAYSYSHLFSIPCVGLRFFTVYGPWGRPDMAYYKFTDRIVKGEPIDVYNYGKMRRDFTYIDDIVKGVLASLDRSFDFEVFNLGNSNTVELEYFIECIEKELGMKAEKNMLPLQPGDVVETYANISKAKNMLGFDPKINIEEGIKKFIEWYQEYHNI